MGLILRCVLAGLLLCATLARAQAPVRLALDAEFGNKTSTSDDAIRAGMEIAIEEINRGGGVLGGRALELVIRDNRGVPARGIDNLRELAALPDMTALFGSKFSPVVLGQLDAAHELRLPLLIPWSAADGIVDNERKPNYVFRLSLRDGWVMPHLLNEAKRRGIRKVGLLVPNGAWGRSNQRAAELHAAKHPIPALVKVAGFEWSDTSLANEYMELVQAGAEAVLVVGNEPEVGLLVRNLAAMPRSDWRPLLAHWGAAAGDLRPLAGPALFEIDLTLVQTYSFLDATSPRARQVLNAAMKKFKVATPAEVMSPVGVAHAYDLVHILARAINQAGSTDRARIRDALENLGAVDGLIRKYNPPFSRDRHEALGPEQLFMARWRKDGGVVRIAR